MADLGWTGVLVPEDQGGIDMGHTAANLLASEMGKTLVSSPFISTAVMAATALRQASDNARAVEALAQIAAGDVTYGLAIDEGPKHSPDCTMMEAKKVGNGFELSGDKTFVVDGANADRLLVLARTGDDDALTLFDIPADREGITRTAQNMIDARDSAAINFDKVEATGEDIIGTVDKAMDVLKPALAAGRAALSAEMVGLSSRRFRHDRRLPARTQTIRHRHRPIPGAATPRRAPVVGNRGHSLHHPERRAHVGTKTPKTLIWRYHSPKLALPKPQNLR